jgi:hypothetical protein
VCIDRQRLLLLARLGGFYNRLTDGLSFLVLCIEYITKPSASTHISIAGNCGHAWISNVWIRENKKAVTRTRREIIRVNIPMHIQMSKWEAGSEPRHRSFCSLSVLCGDSTRDRSTFVITHHSITRELLASHFTVRGEDSFLIRVRES